MELNRLWRPMDKKGGGKPPGEEMGTPGQGGGGTDNGGGPRGKGGGLNTGGYRQGNGGRLAGVGWVGLAKERERDFPCWSGG